MKSMVNLTVIAVSLSFVLGCSLLSGENTDENLNINANINANENTVENENVQPAAPTVKNRTVNVRFGRGKTSRAYPGTVEPGAKHTYLIEISKDQQLNVNINSAKNNALFVVQDPVGKKISPATVGDTSFSQKVPANGRYRIVVTGTGGDARYNIDFGVSALPKPATPAPPTPATPAPPAPRKPPVANSNANANI